MSVAERPAEHVAPNGDAPNAWPRAGNREPRR
jgi:hypothetical protein